MKNLLISIFAVTFLLGGCIEEDAPECDRDSDCASWQECSGSYCVNKPDEPDPGKPSGTVIVGCNCASTSAFPGQTSPNSSCASGSDVVQSCGSCCAFDGFGNCLGVSWRKVCL